MSEPQGRIWRREAAGKIERETLRRREAHERMNPLLWKRRTAQSENPLVSSETAKTERFREIQCPGGSTPTTL